MRTPTGWIDSERKPGTSKVILCFISRLALSIMETVPPISALTQTSELSGVNSANRGRESTRTLWVISLVSVSMKCAILVVSEVLTIVFPSGLMPIPSGSTPTGTSARTCLLSRSMTVTRLSSSLAT
ncbi:hypothetical protein D3C72_1783580 [compost metagenome]